MIKTAKTEGIKRVTKDTDTEILSAIGFWNAVQN